MKLNEILKPLLIDILQDLLDDDKQVFIEKRRLGKTYHMKVQKQRLETANINGPKWAVMWHGYLPNSANDPTENHQGGLRFIENPDDWEIVAIEDGFLLREV